jgi:hypothetical protein
VDTVQLGKQYHAFLFIGIGAGDHRDNGISLAGIVGQMRNVSGWFRMATSTWWIGVATLKSYR